MCVFPKCLAAGEGKKNRKKEAAKCGLSTIFIQMQEVWNQL